MTIRFIFSFLCPCMLLVSSVYSQVNYLEREQSGFSVGVGNVSNEDGTGLRGSVSYGGGNADVMVSVSRVAFSVSYLDGYVVNRKVGGAAISAELFLDFIRENSTRIPISVSLFAGYETN